MKILNGALLVLALILLILFIPGSYLSEVGAWMEWVADGAPLAGTSEAKPSFFPRRTFQVRVDTVPIEYRHGTKKKKFTHVWMRFAADSKGEVRLSEISRPAGYKGRTSISRGWQIRGKVRNGVLGGPWWSKDYRGSVKNVALVGGDTLIGESYFEKHGIWYIKCQITVTFPPSEREFMAEIFGHSRS